MKSPGKDRKKAFEQAKTYANALQNADMPKGILICDFVRTRGISIIPEKFFKWLDFSEGGYDRISRKIE